MFAKGYFFALAYRLLILVNLDIDLDAREILLQLELVIFVKCCRQNFTRCDLFILLSWNEDSLLD